MNQSAQTNSEKVPSRLRRLGAWAKRTLPFVLSILIAFGAFLAYYFIVISPKELTDQQVNDAIANAIASVTPAPPYSELVYQVIQPSLILIQTKGPSEGENTGFGLGSGVVIDETGNILTSLHVVKDADEITVTFADGTKSKAQVTLAQPENDIAVIQALQLPSVIEPAILGNPNSMHVGDEAYVVGNPFGLYSSMSAGVISGFDRSFQPPDSDYELHGMIQIDAAVNPGNSGGPLLNRYGYVIGIITGIVNPTDQNFFVGIGFAVPINVAVSGIGSPPY